MKQDESAPLWVVGRVKFLLSHTFLEERGLTKFLLERTFEVQALPQQDSSEHFVCFVMTFACVKIGLDPPLEKSSKCLKRELDGYREELSGDLHCVDTKIVNIIVWSPWFPVRLCILELKHLGKLEFKESSAK